MPTTQKRIQYHRYGGPELMRLETFEPAPLGAGQLQIRVLAAAANPMDWRIRNGDVKLMTGRNFPRGLGHDFAGVVEAIGPEVSAFRVGDPVLGASSLKASGAFAQTVVADETQIVSKPEELSYEEAATIPTVGVTARQALFDKGRLTAGQSVFITGCLGGVGRTAAQLAKLEGASVGGSCRPSSRQEAVALGIEPLVDFDFHPDEISQRFDLVFDTAGTLGSKAARALLKPGGRVVDINGTPAKMARSALSGSFNVLIAQYRTEDLGRVAAAVTERALEIPIALTVPLGAAIAALTELEAGNGPRGGKLVITMD